MELREFLCGFNKNTEGVLSVFENNKPPCELLGLQEGTKKTVFITFIRNLDKEIIM